jgi:hypothetical protein
MQEKFSACDNPMSLRGKKVAGKLTDSVFYAKNDDFVLLNFSS